MADRNLPRLTVKAWRSEHRNGPDLVRSVSLLMYDDKGRVGQTWCLTQDQAEAVFGKDEVAALPLLPDMKDAVEVVLSLTVAE